MPTAEQSDVVMDALKARYFDLCAKEDIGNTPELTKQIDELESAIRAHQPKATR
jgi:hypothetical protein